MTTVSDVMDLDVEQGEHAQQALQLQRMNETLERIALGVDGLTRRVEQLEELPEDLWPMVEGITHAVTRALGQLEADGILARGPAALGALEALTRPEVLAVVTQAARATADATADPGPTRGLFAALRDRDARRGLVRLAAALAAVGRAAPEPTDPPPATLAGTPERRTR
ncbi:MAG: hypothetical protein RH859_06375 [Longimicrobiales bacterium]